MKVYCKKYPQTVVYLQEKFYAFENGVCEIPDSLAIELARNDDYSLGDQGTVTGYKPFNPDTWTKDHKKLIWDGPIGYNNGYGNASMMFMQGLDEIKGVDLNIIASKWQGTILDHMPKKLEEILKKVTNDIDSYYVKFFPAFEFRDRVAERYIGYTMLEASRIPQSWVDNMNRSCERVVVPCSHQKQAFIDSGVKRDIEVVPLGLRVGKYPEVDIIDDGSFVFGTMGTLTYRKGTDVLVKAFLKAFPKDKYPDVELFIKTLATGGVANAWFLDRDLMVNDGRINLYAQTMSPEELNKEFFGKINCFVFPTRGEGFGLPPLEAMCVGLPTIATNWSGTGDFIKDGVAYPLSYDLVDVPNGDWRGYPEELRADGMQWAEPSVDHLVELMREVYENRDKAYKKGKKASKFVRKNYNNVATSQMLVDYLDRKF